MKEYSKRFYNHTVYFLDEACTIIHRDNDLPAIIYDDGTQLWYQNGKRHRETGPAFIYPDGKKEYWLNGIWCSEKQFYHEVGKPYLLTFL